MVFTQICTTASFLINLQCNDKSGSAYAPMPEIAQQCLVSGMGYFYVLAKGPFEVHTILVAYYTYRS